MSKIWAQRVFDDEGNEFLVPINTTLVSNEDGKYYQVEIFKELTKKYKLMPLTHS